MKVFVSDGSYPNSLAAVRALGRHGIRVTVGERESVALPATVGFWSRHCAQRFRYPDPRSNEEATVTALREHFQREVYDAAIPVGLEMVDIFVRHRDRLGVPTMLPPSDSFRIAADKRLTYEYAARAGVDIPETVPASRWRQLDPPVVFKHLRSGAFIAATANDAQAYAARIAENIDEYIAQAYVDGCNGFGYFGFFEDGVEQGYFMHQRMMQFPREGGPSVVARAIRDERLHESGKALLTALRWHGVAMVEFKRSDRDERFYLMEINPKLWGSLDLAIESGCNFPLWIAQALGSDGAMRDRGYTEGVTYQWVMPHGLRTVLQYPEFRKPFVQNLISRDVRTDLRWSDPVATAAGLLTMAASTAKR